LNEDLGEISLSKLKENSPTVLQTPTLLYNHYISSGFYKSFQNSPNHIKTSQKKISFKRSNIKNKIAAFILHKYFVGISPSVPFHYYSLHTIAAQPSLQGYHQGLLGAILQSP
jgi:hypothetical protein